MAGDSFSKQDIEAMLLHKFIKRGAWQDYHIYESDVPKGFPPKIRGDIMKAAKELKRSGLMISFPHGKEHVWILNKERSAEILAIVKRFYRDEYDTLL
jgi:hypothetical protein